MNNAASIPGMHPLPLQHTYPYWDTPEHDPHSDDLVECWRGEMRIVRSKQRARLLRRRGVPLLRSIDGAWMWFVKPRTAGGDQ